MSESTVKGPQVRIRVNHTRTARDGWKLSETTVEIDGEATFIDGRYDVLDGTGYTTRITAMLTDLMQDAFAAGEAEAQRRNNADRNAALASVPDDVDTSEIPF